MSKHNRTIATSFHRIIMKALLPQPVHQSRNGHHCSEMTEMPYSSLIRPRLAQLNHLLLINSPLLQLRPTANTTRIFSNGCSECVFFLPGRCKHWKRYSPLAARSEEHTSELQSLMRIS